MSAAETLRDRALRAAAEVVDPEIPVLTIADLGVLRDVREVDGAVEVLITPTYSGCPAMNMIAVEVEMALERAGIPRARVRTVLSPAWTTDWMTEEGRQKLHDYGIAPPGRTGGRRALFGEEDEVEVLITPTYSGCPAMNMIAVEVEMALERAGIPRARVRTVLSPAWTTDWMTEEGRQKLHDYGIAPPGRTGGRRALFGEEDEVACPRCGSARTERIAEFGSTSCKALWRCLACREPFDHFRCH